MGECQIYTAANLKQIQTKTNAQNIVISWKGLMVDEGGDVCLCLPF